MKCPFQLINDDKNVSRKMIIKFEYIYIHVAHFCFSDELNHECFGERSVFLQGTHVGDYCSKGYHVIKIVKLMFI